MPDRSVIDSVAQKFEAWATSLGSDEQEALAEWMSRNDDVTAHTNDIWWQDSGAWSRAWSESWNQ
jgi:hypothetical protein